MPSLGEVHINEASEVNRIEKNDYPFATKVDRQRFAFAELLPKLLRRSSGVEE